MLSIGGVVRQAHGHFPPNRAFDQLIGQATIRRVSTILAMKVALSQINPIVGDIAGNTALIVRDIQAAIAQNADMIVFPELAIIGYPPKDLLLKPDVLDSCEQTINYIAQTCKGITAIVGYPTRSNRPIGRALFNTAAVCRDGEVVYRQHKSLLPTYDVFDESRYFEPSNEVQTFDVNGVPVGIAICEDLWNQPKVIARRLYTFDPLQSLEDQGAQVIVNPAASPFELPKHAFRRKLFSNAARQHGVSVVFVNQVGGNDELVFDGNSCVYNADGNIIAQAKDFQEDLVIADLDTSRPVTVSDRSESSAVYQALTLGLRDYCRKCGFKRIVLGLSGGIDSAVTACVAVEAIGKENVIGIAMPSRYSSEGSVSDAQLLAERLDIEFHTIPIEDAHKTMEAVVTPYFEGRQADTTEENVQARLRGVILMSFSNKFGALLTTTGNKSEMAVGYCTLYGDMCGGLAVLCDVPKTMVYRLAEWINTDECSLKQACGTPPIPVDTITKPPSAELRPDQTDQDSLPPYEILDEIVDRYVERNESTKVIADAMSVDLDLVRRFARLIDLNEYKRKQAPPGLKITSRAFGFGRRLPIAQRYDVRGFVEFDKTK